MGQDRQKKLVYLIIAICIFLSILVVPASANSTETMVVHLMVVIPPIAGFYSNVAAGHVPLTVVLYDQSTGAPTSWNWEFGDGVMSTLQNQVHTYTAGGVYSVTLTVSNSSGTNSTTKINYITVFPRGDFNENLRVDISDVTRVAYMAVGLITPTDPKADFDGQNGVDVGDASKIAWYYVGKIGEL
jgi:PKD repeat protein